VSWLVLNSLLVLFVIVPHEFDIACVGVFAEAFAKLLHDDWVAADGFLLEVP